MYQIPEIFLYALHKLRTSTRATSVKKIPTLFNKHHNETAQVVITLTRHILEWINNEKIDSIIAVHVEKVAHIPRERETSARPVKLPPLMFGEVDNYYLRPHKYGV